MNTSDFKSYQMKSPSLVLPRHSVSSPTTSLNIPQHKFPKNESNGLQIDTSSYNSNKPRRLWVKRGNNGNPTTVLAEKDSIVDDLKSLIVNKYPNTIGRFDDAANLILKIHFSNSNIPSTSPTAKLTDSKDLILEPDQNVWEMLDNYFPQGMQMKDALIIDSDSTDQLETYAKPSPQIETTNFKNFPLNKTHTAGSKDRSMSPSIPNQKSLQRSTSQTNVITSANTNPQAVLLLPKNFSINNNKKTLNDSTELDPKSDDQQQEKLTTPPPDIKTITKETKPEKTVDPALDKVLPSISVLVVEDNAINQAILGAFLRKRKIKYQIAKNGQEAIDKWKKGGFHLVLMDIQLPVKSGIEATKEIRQLEKLNKIGVFDDKELSKLAVDDLTTEDRLDSSTFRSPVIIVALTASSNSSVDRKNALTAGCNDYLTKPVNLVWLQNKITEWGCMQALIDFDGWKSKNNWNSTST
ncbi:SSK1 [Candida pseudojiufengensis]|uniref:SSK1 n=1 Tax=Candida pseudojiufengensis TaxID=497109 RepID=UPI00222596B0|nr:SSK1 [Candida pseudojiufengensis]KAI5962294.1 SSK1 [Candida pseudojiufengensis]